MAPIYVSGHRNPDTDSIAAAIGYAELKGTLDSDEHYVPVRLGECNNQTRWLLARSGAREPRFLPHVMLRARDVMRQEFPVASIDEPVRSAGRALARSDLELVPVIDDEGAIVGVLTERALARRYLRDSLRTSTLEEAPTLISAIVSVLEGTLVIGADRLLSGRVWVYAMDPSSDSGISEGDIVVVGNRPDATMLVIELGASLVVFSNNAPVPPEAIEAAQRHGTALAVSPLDSYVCGRMVTLSAPCSALMESDPLTVPPDFLLDDIAEQIRWLHYGAAITVDKAGRPVGLVTRSDLSSPVRRRIILVDHAETAQSAVGIAEAEIVEILDHHHIGSIETRVPVAATFDPVGCTCTLVVERFRRAGLEPSRESALMMLGAVLSDTVILNSATTTPRDEAVVAYLAGLLDVDAQALGREMFKETADVSDLSADEIINHDAKRYQVRGEQEICIAQVEVVGNALDARRPELLEALAHARESKELALYALMITDVAAKGTEMLVSGDVQAVARSFGVEASDSSIELPGVMSRKKEVAPKLMAAF
jgi:manganese-dependent inorganic pyrophosphatase